MRRRCYKTPRSTACGSSGAERLLADAGGEGARGASGSGGLLGAPKRPKVAPKRANVLPTCSHGHRDPHITMGEAHCPPCHSC